MSSEPTRSTSRFQRYAGTLKRVSVATRTPLPSLLVSFGILHELTAIIPLVGVFYAARTLGIGESVVDALRLRRAAPSGASAREEAPNDGWLKNKIEEWVDEGSRWAYRVGHRYGIFGLEKRPQNWSVDTQPEPQSSPSFAAHLAGDIANAVVAYGATKALLPVRIGLSLYLSPAFSRGVIEPFRKVIVQSFKRNKL